jgi:TolB-like protein
MKKIFLVICAVLFFAPFPVCAAERNVIGNTFQSSYPKMNINVDPQFKYLGKTDNTRNKKRESSIYAYIFALKEKDNRVNKYLFIQIRTKKQLFIDNAVGSKKNLDFNKVQIDGESFKYFKRLISMPADSLVANFFSKAGCVIPVCGIINTFYSFPDLYTMVSINYVEDVSPLDMSCGKTYSRETLSENQRRYLADFHKRAFSSIGMGVPETTQQAAAAPPPSALKGKEESPKKSAKADGKISISRLSIFNFNAANLDSSRYGPEVTNLLTDALGKNKAFSILSRHDLQEFLRLNDLQQNDNLGELVNIGSRLGLNFIVTGRIEKKGVILAIECIVVNVQDEKVIFTRKFQAMGDSSLASEVSKMSDSITAAIANSAR